MAKLRQPPTPAAHIAAPAPARPVLAEQVPPFVLLERQVDDEFRPHLSEALQRKIDALGDGSSAGAPCCPQCGAVMRYHERPAVGWLTRFGRLRSVGPAKH